MHTKFYIVTSLGSEETEILPMVRNLYPVSLNTEKGMRFLTSYYLLEITTFPMSQNALLLMTLLERLPKYRVMASNLPA